jgi:hypothetical protein
MKQIISIIIVSLACMFIFELSYNLYLYDDKEEILQRIENIERVLNNGSIKIS